ncbi:ribosomal RNA processing protein 1 homolog [Hyposmocoma kahamanoa]|uniref:ribosomal RNA processing protein 1 homolog n=1 Tax=Hyposmocoma kahamanoa TaxID=1477025 RepID=UPI000E6D9206|nr:ribosomal RNA processing protein 1 homolog [Hyposmocoma kahamanoa]
MKIADKNKVQQQKNKKKTIVEPKREQVLIVAQEIRFARLLADNEKKTRDRAVKSLKKWLINCFQRNYEFKEDDFTRIWKGLFYAVWMSDKPLVQEELCDNIASILDQFPPDQLRHALLLVKSGFKVLAAEWYGIDQHRIDKCLMLVRRYLRGSLRCLQRCDWSVHSCKMYSKMFTAKDGLLCVNTPVYARNATSMILHIIDCFLEELAKVSGGSIPLESMSELLRPFCQLVCLGENPALSLASRQLLSALLRQSDAGLQYQERTRAWEQMGCPEGGPDALELASDDDGDEQNAAIEEDLGVSQETPLDPRAGRVDVLLPSLPVPAAQLAQALRQLLAHAPPRAQRRARICLQRFETLSKSEYPLRITTSPLAVRPLPPALPAARSLAALERTLISASDELALRGLSRKHRKRLLAKSRAGLSIVEDVQTQNGLSTESATGNWKVEEEPEKDQKDTSNKENIGKNKKRKMEKTTDIVTKKQKLDVKEANADKGVKKEKTKKLIQKQSVDRVKNAPALIKEKKNQKPETEKSEPTQRPVIEAPRKPKTDKLKHEPAVVAKKVKNFQKQLSPKTDKTDKNSSLHTPKKVKFVLKNNSMQGTIDYYKSVKQSPNIPFDSSKKPVKTNLKPSTPSPINPFFKKKMKLKIK